MTHFRTVWQQKDGKLVSVLTLMSPVSEHLHAYLHRTAANVPARLAAATGAVVATALWHLGRRYASRAR